MMTEIYTGNDTVMYCFISMDCIQIHSSEWSMFVFAYIYNSLHVLDTLAFVQKLCLPAITHKLYLLQELKLSRR